MSDDKILKEILSSIWDIPMLFDDKKKCFKTKKDFVNVLSENVREHLDRYTIYPYHLKYNDISESYNVIYNNNSSTVSDWFSPIPVNARLQKVNQFILDCLKKNIDTYTEFCSRFGSSNSGFLFMVTTSLERKMHEEEIHQYNHKISISDVSGKGFISITLYFSYSNVNGNIVEVASISKNKKIYNIKIEDLPSDLFTILSLHPEVVEGIDFTSKRTIEDIERLVSVQEMLNI